MIACPLHAVLQGDEAGPSKKAAVAGVDNTARRQFDLEQFREQAAKRELEESELDGLTPYEVKQLKRRRTRYIRSCKVRLQGFSKYMY